ncbi:hypothetical protein [Catellatospora sichuanensis]|uniref:hypothetical protein n=1 Tax=Catellatospora sichuanensis TaxID=1969805 RepID=UPI001182FA8E|nr:hypothetical protein [Catellatospora sichuanensis]
MSDSAPQYRQPAQPTGAPTGTQPPTGPSAATRRVGLLGKVLIGLSGVAWLLTVVVTGFVVVALLKGELEGMAVLSGIIMVAIALGVAVLITGVTLLYLYLARRRRR